MSRLGIDLRVFGMTVVESSIMPLDETPEQEARRIVRHGLKDITLHGKPLVDPGPEPGFEPEVTIVADEQGRNPVAFVSPGVVYALRRAMPSNAPWPPARSDLLDDIRRGRHELLRDQLESVDVDVRTAEEKRQRRLRWAARLLDIAIEARHMRERLEERLIRRQNERASAQALLDHTGFAAEPWQLPWVETAMRLETHARMSVARPRDHLTIVTPT